MPQKPMNASQRLTIICSACILLTTAVGAGDLSASADFKRFTSTPNPDLSFEAVIQEPETIVEKRTNRFQVKGSRNIKYSSSTNSFVYSEVLALPGLPQQRTDITKEGNVYQVNTLVNLTNAYDGTAISFKGELPTDVNFMNPISVAVARANERIRTVLNMGFTDPARGGLQWDGATFTATGTGNTANHLKGTLSEDVKGHPMSVDFTKVGSAGLFRFRIVYSHLRPYESLGAILPSDFKVENLDAEGHATSEVRTVTISRLAVTDPRAIREAVQRASTEGARMRSQMVVEGRMLYERMPDGRLVPDRMLTDASAKHFSRGLIRTVFWGAVTLLTIGFLLFHQRGGKQMQVTNKVNI